MGRTGELPLRFVHVHTTACPLSYCATRFYISANHEARVNRHRDIPSVRCEFQCGTQQEKCIVKVARYGTNRANAVNMVECLLPRHFHRGRRKQQGCERAQPIAILGDHIAVYQGCVTTT